MIRVPIVSVLLSAAVLIAQPTPDPMTASIVGAESVVGQSPIRVELVNRSSKPISAYVLMFDYHDSQGKKVWSNARLAASSGVIPTLKGRPFEPGKVWLETVTQHPSSNSEQYSVKVGVDYVLFLDGSRWGPDIAKKSVALDGMREGIRALEAGRKQ